MIPVQITCRGFSCTDSISAAVSKHVERLEKFYNRIIRCEVIIDRRHRHHQHGQIFHVQIHLQLPKDNVVINREPEKNHAHEEFSVALRDAFRSAKRKLEDAVRIRRGFIKNHRVVVRMNEAVNAEELAEV